jgi:hypothetical protein
MGYRHAGACGRIYSFICGNKVFKRLKTTLFINTATLWENSVNHCITTGLFCYLCTLQTEQMKVSAAIMYFLAFTLVIAIPPVILHQTGNKWPDDNFWVLFAFMGVLTILLLIGMVSVFHKKNEFFAQAFLGGTTIKILVCFAFIFFFLRNNKVNKHLFLLDFFYIYLLNTAFEVYILLRNLRHKISR